jgi:TolB protein
MHKRLLYLPLWLFLIYSTPALAILTIEITGGSEQGTHPIAIVPFQLKAGVLPPPQDLPTIISNDLYRSGRFSPLPTHLLPEQPARAQQINYSRWQQISIPHIVIGRIFESVNGYSIEFQLVDIYTREQIVGYRYQATTQTLRQVAHQISDQIYQALIGNRGIFSTRIVYVTVYQNGKNSQYQLYIADADGANPHLMLKSNEPIFSPSWAPNGEKIAYVTYDTKGRTKRMAVYIQDIQTGRRTRLAAYKGLNAAPAWSPDGNSLALTLSKDGNPEIYVMNLLTRTLTRLTNHAAIDTEPEWAPDGQSLVFTSDRSGQPQIYQISHQGGKARRLTFQGTYNARPRISPDGTQLALLHNGGNGYQIDLFNLETKQWRILTQTTLDESPSFAPNGSMIIYATGTELAAVSIDGKIRQRLAVNMSEEVREPAWSPFFY